MYLGAYTFPGYRPARFPMMSPPMQASAPAPFDIFGQWYHAQGRPVVQPGLQGYLGTWLGSVNCIYDDGTVVPLDQGPCEEVRSSGAYLVDSNVSETEIDVTTPAPGASLPMVLLGGLLLSTVLSGRRRK